MQIPDEAAQGGLSGNQPLPELTSVRKFCREVGIHSCTHWRWVKRGWIAQPLDIAGRKYHRREDITKFLIRAAKGEFAANFRPPRRERRDGI